MSERMDAPAVDVSEMHVQERQEKHAARRWLVVAGGLLWLLAVAGMVTLSLFIHMHRQPLPFELAFSRSVQAIITAPWTGIVFRFLTAINDPLPDAITVPIVAILFMLLRRFRQAIFLLLSVGVGNGIDALIGDYVGRPRPTANLVRVDSRLIFNSFPSGHCCHMMVFYGFLLFLSFHPAVRRWRYHWLVLIFQCWAVLNIVIMGLARIWEGEHWLLDIAGGYLDGAIWMTLFIVLYLVSVKYHWGFHRRDKAVVERA